MKEHSFVSIRFGFEDKIDELLDLARQDRRRDVELLAEIRELADNPDDAHVVARLRAMKAKLTLISPNQGVST